MATAKKRVFEIIQIGNRRDIASAGFDIFIVLAISCNLIATLLSTFEDIALDKLSVKEYEDPFKGS